jgi:hypothetical protein
MNLNQLKNELIADILNIKDKDLLLHIQHQIKKKTSIKRLVQVNLSEILQYDVKDTNPEKVSLGKHQCEVKSWKDLYATVIIWILDDRNISELEEPIHDHFGRTKYAVSYSPTHAEGKPFTSQVQHGKLYIEGHGDTEHHLKTLVSIFQLFGIAPDDLSISFWMNGSNNAVHITL